MSVPCDNLQVHCHWGRFVAVRSILYLFTIFLYAVYYGFETLYHSPPIVKAPE